MRDANYTVPCPLWPKEPNRCETILILKRLFSSLSLIGCVFIIFIIWLFRHYKSQVQRLTLYLSISAGLQSISYVVGDLYPDKDVCRFQSFITQYFDWSTLLWVCIMSLNMVLVIHNRSSTTHEKWFHLCCWGVPLIWASLPFIGNKYGMAGLWCWIVRDATAMRFGTWYVPVFILLVVLVVVYVYIIATVLRSTGAWSGFNKADEERDKNMLAKEVKPLAAFPLIYIAFSIPNLIYRIDDAVHPDKLPSYPLLILNVIFMPSIGSVNSIAFALYSEIQKLLTWRQIKFAFLGHFQANAHVVHNVDIGDEEVLGSGEGSDGSGY